LPRPPAVEEAVRDFGEGRGEESKGLKWRRLADDRIDSAAVCLERTSGTALEREVARVFERARIPLTRPFEGGHFPVQS